MKFLMIYETTSEGLARAPEHFQAHVTRLQQFHASGTLLLAGPLVNPTDGAFGVFTTREAAEEFIREDPFVLNGVVASWRIREWDEVLGE